MGNFHIFHCSINASSRHSNHAQRCQTNLPVISTHCDNPVVSSSFLIIIRFFFLMVLNFNSWPPLPFLHVYFLVFLTLHSPHLEASFRSVLGLPWMDPPLIFEWKFVTCQTPDPLVMNSVDGSESRALGTCKRIVS